MANIIRGKSDPVTKRFAAALNPYERLNPEAKIELFRRNWASIRIRIIDSAFEGIDLPERHDTVWRYLDVLSKDDLGSLSLLLLLTPEEAKDSFANFNFELPILSGR
jgi:stress-induced morphogen